MLELRLFDSSRELHDLSFIPSKYQDRRICIVVPSPTIADDARLHFSKLDDCGEIITISKFRKDCLFKLSCQQDEVRKADLMVLLSTVWKRLFAKGEVDEDCRFEAFVRTFNLFTDLRSFSLNLDLISTVLEEYDEVLGNGVMAFWNICQQLDIVDEHRSYSLISEAHRQAEPSVVNDEPLVYIFFGFSIMSAGQVDLLKALAIRNEVIVPYPTEAYEKRRDLDWVSWLDASVMEGGTQNQELDNKLEVYEFSKNNLSLVLKNLSKELYGESKIDVYLGGQNVNFGSLMEIPLEGLYFKSSADLFGDICDDFFLKLDDILQSSIATEEVMDFIDQETRGSLEAKKFRSLKVTSLFRNVVDKWRSLSDANELMTRYDLRVLKYVHQLMLPRNFSFPLFSNAEQIKGAVASLEGLGRLNDDHFNLLCVTSDHGQMSLSDSRFSENVLSLLAPIGPIPRSEMDFLLVKSSILDLVRTPQRAIFIEQGILSESLMWNEVFKDFDIVKKYFHGDKTQIDTKGMLQDKEVDKTFDHGLLSATKIQSYLDCPQQYYYKYVKPIAPFVSLDNDLLPNQLGQLQHKVIEEYFKNCTRKETFVAEFHQQLVEKNINQFLAKNNISLISQDYRKYMIEVSDYSRNAIEELIKLFVLDANLKMYFERSIKNDEITGSIDCLIEGRFGYILIDFKRSSSSIPGFKELFEYKKIQLWFYLNHLGIDVKNIFAFGFLNLSQVEDSLVFAADELAKDELTEKAGFLSSGKIYVDKMQIDERISEYDAAEKVIVDSLKCDGKFAPDPREASVCTYCSIKNICSRR